MTELLFYIRKEDLRAVLDYYEVNTPADAGQKGLKGLLFGLGISEERKVILHYKPVYSDQDPGDPPMDVSIENTIGTEPGCPYPPGYLAV